MKFRNIITLSLLLILGASSCQAQKFNMLIGTYTNPTRPEGIFVYEFDSKTGKATLKNKVAVTSPSYLAVTNDRKFVYSVSEGNPANINAFSYNSKTGELKAINTQPSGSGGPTYISVDASGKYVFAANYGGGSLTAIPIEKDGSLGADKQDFKHATPRARAHSAVLSPDNKYIFTSFLGIDTVKIFSLDPAKRPNAVTFVSAIPLDKGAGPRHSTFHPNKKFYYVMTELSSNIYAFTYDAGQVKQIQKVDTKPSGHTGASSGADIHVSADGKFLYATNRAELNEIVIYSVDQKTGQLTFVARQPTGGKSTRTFDFDPTGNYLLVTSQGTNEVIIFKRNQKTGILTPTGDKIAVGAPGIVKFVKID